MRNGAFAEPVTTGQCGAKSPSPEDSIHGALSLASPSTETNRQQTKVGSKMDATTAYADAADPFIPVV